MSAAVMLDPVKSATAADRAGTDAIALARSRGKQALLTVVEPLAAPVNPLSFLDAAVAALGGGVLWSQEAAGLAFAGAGEVLTLQATGSDRFAAIMAQMHEVRDRLIAVGADLPFPMVGGFAFSDGEPGGEVWVDFPSARIVVPRVLLQTGGGVTALRVTVPVTPDSDRDEVQHEISTLLDLGRTWAARDDTMDGTSTPSGKSPQISERLVRESRSVPSRPEWEASVATAVSLIRQGAIDKVVLAREERIEAISPILPVAVLARLRAADATATLFALHSGDAWFIGATPERLVRLDRGRVDVTCLAGSIGIGATDAERAALAARLLASEKDRREHEIVVESTIAALSDVCESVERQAGTPRVVAARSVQHLETPVSGYLTGAGHVLDLVERLHPTPAVGGHPRLRALPLIEALETIERGWYAGPFGWTSLDGSGEFSVAIRSALLRERSASLFAGCGIVADSVPADEFAETCLKLRPMLAALERA